jgi:hypothetical protein
VKTFYSLEDIETLVAQGLRELIVDEDSVLTDVAQDAAQRMGLKLVQGRGPAAPAGALAPAAAAPLGRQTGAGGAGARPRGCQHGPVQGHGLVERQSPLGEPRAAGAAPGPGRARPAAPAGGLVDDLVDAVRKMASQGSAG